MPATHALSSPNVCQEVAKLFLIRYSTLQSNIKVIPKVTLSSPSLWACFHPLSLVLVAFAKYEILLNLNTKCWNSAFNAQGSRVIIVVVVQVGATKIYVAVVEALRRKERQDGTQFTTKIGGKTSFGPNYLVL
jgi:hypothetical protein